jgi:hypothetical protein
VVITGNVFSDASAAVQLYAQSFGFIIDGNKSVRTGGMYGIGTDSPGQKQRRRYSTCSFNQWLNNDLSEGFVYQQGSFMHGIVGPCAGGGTLDPPAITTMGNIVRGNTARDHFTLGALYFGNHPLTPGTTSAGCYGRDTIVENNVIADTPLALEVYPLYIDTVLRGNRVTGAAVPLSDDGTRTWIHPAERLAYQVAAVKAMLGAEAHLAPIEAAVAALAKSPAASPDAPPFIANSGPRLPARGRGALRARSFWRSSGSATSSAATRRSCGRFQRAPAARPTPPSASARSRGRRKSPPRPRSFRRKAGKTPRPARPRRSSPRRSQRLRRP